jgi:hypothetical protein
MSEETFKPSGWRGRSPSRHILFELGTDLKHDSAHESTIKAQAADGV